MKGSISVLREPHLLKPTTGNRRPVNVLFVDTETEPVPLEAPFTKHKLKLGVAIYARSENDKYLVPRTPIRFTKASQFWQAVGKLTRPKTKTYLVAHNVLFDLTVLDAFNALPADGWELKSFYEKGFTSIFRWQRDKANLIALDNGNLFSGKLEKWGRLVGLPKIEIDFKTCSLEELFEYCQGDVEIMLRLWRLWLAFLDTHDCGDFRMTVASTAFGTWRHRFMPKGVYIHSDAPVLELERASYRGGRVEALYQGKLTDGPYYYVDVNNMYGHILREHEFPYSLIDYSEQANPTLLKRRLEKYAVVARVVLDVTENWFPLKASGRTFYPLGRFRSTLTTGELELALTRGWVRSVEAMAWYQARPLFSEYVTYFNDLRQHYIAEDALGMATICKLLVNSLYGKFGQRGFKQKVIGSEDASKVGREFCYSPAEDAYWSHTWLAGQMFKEWQEGESYHSFPAIAAHVTAYARLFLTDIVMRVTKGHVFYMDTDSLIVDAVGLRDLEPLIDDSALGKIKIELESAWAVINAPKDYAMHDRVRIKGVSAKARKLGKDLYSQDQWVRLAGMLARGDVGSYVTRKVEKRLLRRVYSGSLRSNGWIDPFRLDRLGDLPPLP